MEHNFTPFFLLPTVSFTDAVKTAHVPSYRRNLVQVYGIHNLVPRASFPLTSGRKTRALGASIFK